MTVVEPITLPGNDDDPKKTQDAPKAEAKAQSSVGKLQEIDRRKASGCCSRMTLCYASHLLTIAYTKRRIEPEDCWRHGDKPEILYAQFEKIWAEEQKKKKPALTAVLWKMNANEFRFGALMFGFAQLMQVIMPLFLQRAVLYLEMQATYPDAATCKRLAPSSDTMLCTMQDAMIIPVLFAASLLIQSVFMAQASQSSLRIALKFRTVTTSAIFKKSMRLSSIGAGSSSAGQVSNLVSNDNQQFLQFAPMMHMAWTAPIFIVLSFVLLALAVGPSFLAGLGVIMMIVPVMIFCLTKALGLRAKMLKFTDERVKLASDVLTGLRVIKAYGWEEAVMKKMGDARRSELKLNASRGLWTSCMIVFVFLAPVFNAIGIFSVYSFTGGEFTASRVFMALAAMNSMRFALIFGPFLAIQWSNVRVACKRMQAFLEQDELLDEALTRPIPAGFLTDGSTPVSQEIVVTLDNVNAAWAVAEPKPVKGKGKGKGKGKKCFGCFGGKKKAKEEGKGVEDVDEKKNDGEGKNLVMVKRGEKEFKMTQALFDINFKAEVGNLTALVGSVGCGKSSLVQCLLGSMEILQPKDSLGTKNEVQGTVKCQGTTAYVAQQAFILNATIKRNITLSDRDVLSTDDEALYQQCLSACALRSDLDQLPGGDMTEIGERGVNLSGGQKQRISLARAIFSRAEIVILDDPLSAVDAHVGKHLAAKVIGPTGMLAGKTRIFVTHQLQYLRDCDNIYMMEDGKITQSGDYVSLVKGGHLEEQEINQDFVRLKSGGEVPATGTTAAQARASGVLVMQEEREEGELQFSVLKAYVKSGGVAIFFIWATAIACQTGSELLTQSWLAAWTSGTGMGIERGDDRPIEFYVAIYCALGVAQGIFLFLRNYLLSVVHTRKAAQVLHDRMAKSVLQAQMVFFDRNPLGRILNRFTRDMEYLDVVLVQSISQFMNCLAGTTGAIVMICIIYPYFIVVALIMMVIYYWITKYFRHASRETQRLEAISRSPIFSLLTEAQAGVATIRGYGITELILKMADDVADENTGIYYIMMTCVAWLQMRLDILSMVIMALVIGFPLLQPDLIDPGYAGLAIVYSFELNALMKHGARMSAECEQKFSAVDRVLDYSENIEPEAPWRTEADKEIPAGWPTAGHVKFSDVTMRYRPTLDPALRNISFEVRGGEKVGICGRTGSGKSSLIVTLLRITEFESGDIQVDGLSLNKLGLHSMRQRISMIPQDPVLFSANLRDNLDPLQLATSDEELTNALKLVCLGEEVEKLGGLNYMVTEGGSNFSVGQRQLLCLARSILRKSKLVLLDEATASVDHETDELIQKTIRSEFGASTVMTIAHRMNTILDSDRILVLEKGKVDEYDDPKVLARDENSRLHGLLRSANCMEFIEEAKRDGNNRTSNERAERKDLEPLRPAQCKFGAYDKDLKILEI